VLTITVTLPGGNSGTGLPSEVSVGGALVGPFAFSDDYAVIGNVPLAVDAAGGVLANDFGRQCGGVPAKPGPGAGRETSHLTVVAYDATSANGGTVAMTPDGAFTYSPPTGLQGLDTFAYTMEEAGEQSSATVFCTVEEMVWFIDDLATPGGDGHFERPFDSLFAFNAVQGGGTMLPDIGHWIYVYRGSGQPYDGGIGLLDQQHLIGQGVDLTVGTTTIVPAGVRPVLTNAASIEFVGGGPGAIVSAVPGAVVSLGNANEVRGLDIVGPAEYGVFGQGVSGPTLIDQVGIDDVYFHGISLEFVTGTFQVGDPAGTAPDRVLITNTGGSGIFIDAPSLAGLVGPGEGALTGATPLAALNVVGTTIRRAVEGNGIEAYGVDVDVQSTTIDETYDGVVLYNYEPGVLCTFRLADSDIGVTTPIWHHGIRLAPEFGNIDASIATTAAYSQDSALQAGTSNTGGGTIALALGDSTFGSIVPAAFFPCVQLVAPPGTSQAFLTALTGTVTLVPYNSAYGFTCNEVVFDADPDLAGVQPVAGGTLQIGTGVSNRVQGTALELLSCSGDFTLGTLNVFQSGGDPSGVNNTGTLALTITTATVDHVP
jgi:hypothetical protein